MTGIAIILSILVVLGVVVTPRPERVRIRVR